MPKTPKTKRLCSGCRDNFYNGNNTIGVAECWNFSKAKVVKRLLIPMDQRPPYDRKDTHAVLTCYKRPHYATVDPKVLTLSGFWKG